MLCDVFNSVQHFYSYKELERKKPCRSRQRRQTRSHDRWRSLISTIPLEEWRWIAWLFQSRLTAEVLRKAKRDREPYAAWRDTGSRMHQQSRLPRWTFLQCFQLPGWQHCLWYRYTHGHTTPDRNKCWVEADQSRHQKRRPVFIQVSWHLRFHLIKLLLLDPHVFLKTILILSPLTLLLPTFLYTQSWHLQ